MSRHLVDLLEHAAVELDRIEVMVIDDTDRMLDMRFLPQMRQTVQMVGKPRQTLMSPSTMDHEAGRVAREFLSDSKSARGSKIPTPSAAMQQTIYPVTLEDQAQMPLHLLISGEVNSAIVFMRTGDRADRVTKPPVQDRAGVVAISSERFYSRRNAGLAGFREKHYFDNLALSDAQGSFIHRIGSAAGIGKCDEVLSLMMPAERLSLRGIDQASGTRLHRTRIDGFQASDLAGDKQKTIARQPIVRHPLLRNRRRNAESAFRRTIIPLGQRWAA